MTKSEINTIAKNIINDLDLPSVSIDFFEENTNRLGEYWNETTTPNGTFSISFFGTPTLNTLLHEIAHHTQYCREGKTNHSVKFHRICFEIQDMCKALYGFKKLNVSGKGLYHTISYTKAMREWFNNRQAA